jgi:hypothetical protein
MKPIRLSVALAAVGTLCVAFTPALAAPPPSAGGGALRVSVVASGLNNPKHLSFGPDGRLYVAESGLGDPAKASANCVPVIGTSGGPTTACVGKTGAISRISGGHATPVLSGLESVQLQDDGETLGPADVTFVHGALAVVMQDFDVRADGSNGLPGGDQFGKGILARPGSPRSSWMLFPDFAAFAAEHPQSNPGGVPGETAFDSDPYSITPYRGGFAVTDAAANSLLWISPFGQVKLLARFPTVPEPLGPATIQAQAVPTSVAVGPDGALYVGGLRGVPSLPGTADVYRVVPGQAPTVWATGFSAITDIAFDRHGRLLVLEFSTGGLLQPAPGALLRVERNHSVTTVYGALAQPTGLAVARNGSVYVANNGTSPGSATPPGEVLKLSGGVLSH